MPLLKRTDRTNRSQNPAIEAVTDWECKYRHKRVVPAMVGYDGFCTLVRGIRLSLAVCREIVDVVFLITHVVKMTAVIGGKSGENTPWKMS